MLFASDRMKEGVTPWGAAVRRLATRQAREMKYFSPETDYSALERELSSAKKTKSSDSSRRRYDDEDDYSAYAEKYASYEDEA